MNQKILVIELQYLPCIKYFVYLNSFDQIIIKPNDAYSKQTYRNRCRINGANNIENLIIPTKKNSGKKKLTRDVEIDYNQKWLNKHVRAIISAYGKAPFFEYYIDDIIEVFTIKHKLLFEHNKALLTKCLEILGLNVKIEFGGKRINFNESNVINAINLINPKNTITEEMDYSPIEYFQVFGNKFVENLSIIDLIFCEGPQAKTIIGNRIIKESIEI